MCAIWFGTVYLGHHYVLDVLGGIAYAVIAYLWVRRRMRQ
jgi:membrane-associated phospholipid phosphatase